MEKEKLNRRFVPQICDESQTIGGFVKRRVELYAIPLDICNHLAGAIIYTENANKKLG